MKVLSTEKNNLILTFGYGNRSDYNDFLNYLKEFNIICVVDVRLKPRAWTRKWYGENIKQVCDDNKTLYVSKPALGNISGKSNWIPPNRDEASSALLEVSRIAKNGNIVLLCAERDSSRCHRVGVAGELQSLVGFQIKHLD